MGSIFSKKDQRPHKSTLKIAAIAVVLSLFLTGCLPDGWAGEGSSDGWYFDLCGRYALGKSNRYSISLIHYDDPHINDSGESFIIRSIVLDHFFVTAYQVQEPYIFLEGIRTAELMISDEELDNRKLSYYLVNSETDEISGPFASDTAFEVFCTLQALELGEWIQVDNRSIGPPTNPYLETE